MKFAKNKTMASLIALILMSTMVVSIFAALPIINAHTPVWTDRPTHCYVAPEPPIVGVGQQALIVFWLDWIPPTSTGMYGDRWQFYLNIVKPDGTNETMGPFTSDPVGGAYTNYVPTQLGVYTVQARFPGQKLTGQPLAPVNQPGLDSINDTFAASMSIPAYFTVQQDPITAYQETPLPNDYWTRPINDANRFWYQVTANWLSGAAQSADSCAWDSGGPTDNFGFGKAPESAHIMWATPHWAGGVMDERFGSVGYYSGLSYESYGAPNIIIDGKIFYNDLTPPRYGWWALDLYTGQKIFFHNTTGPVSGIGSGFASSGAISEQSLSFGQIFDFETGNQHGGFPYLWSTTASTPNTWMLFDGDTGGYLCSIANVSDTGTAVYGRDGSILRYNVVNRGTTQVPNYYLQVWNTSKTILSAMYDTTIIGTRGNAYWMWRPIQNYVFNGNLGFSLNVSIASVAGPVNAIANQTGTIRAVREGDSVIVGTPGINDARGTVQGYLRAYSLKQGQEGNKLWEITFTPPKASDAYLNSTYLGDAGGPSLGTVDPEDGVFIFTERITRETWAYSLATGQLLWGPSSPEAQFNYYGMSYNIYQGKLFSYGYAGELVAYDITTGKILWNWTAPSYGSGETFYPYSPLSLACIADGKLYLYSTEHSPSQPLRRDAHVWCVDAETGQLKWAVLHWGSVYLADGFLVGASIFDNMIYCYGKGPSGTTVTAPQTVPSLGSSIMITGTVTDQSPSGRYNSAGSLDFALKGTPAISDASMEAWVEHLFQQRPIPTNATGVPISLDTIDPNGNLVHISNVTSDINGNYGYLFTPDVPGTYQIIATFAGSASYGPSSATTYMGVGEAPVTPAPAATAPVTMDAVNTSVMTYTIIAAIAIIIAIAIVGILLLRKRP